MTGVAGASPILGRPTPALWRAAWWTLAIVLALLTLAYFARAYRIYFGVLLPELKLEAADLHSRWRETQYVLHGQNPFDVAFAHSPQAAQYASPALLKHTRDAHVRPELGVPGQVVYPPWSYVSAMPFVMLPPPYLRWFYAGVMVLMTGLIYAWSWRQGSSFGLAVAAGFTMAGMAISGWVQAIYLGNFPLVLVAALIGVHELTRRGRSWVAGLLLGFALMKPTVGGPFLLAVLFYKAYRTVAIAAGLIIAESLVTWTLTSTPPWVMLQQMMAASGQFVGAGHGPLQYMVRGGMDRTVSTMIVALVFGLGGTLLMWQARGAGLLALFGIAAVTARLASYHYPYDDGMFLFLLVAFALRAARRETWTAFAAFIVVGGVTWMPGRLLDLLAFQLVQQIVWIAAAVYIAWRGQAFDPQPTGDSRSAHRDFDSHSTAVFAPA